MAWSVLMKQGKKIQLEIGNTYRTRAGGLTDIIDYTYGSTPWVGLPHGFNTGAQWYSDEGFYFSEKQPYQDDLVEFIGKTTCRKMKPKKTVSPEAGRKFRTKFGKIIFLEDNDPVEVENGTDSTKIDLKINQEPVGTLRMKYAKEIILAVATVPSPLAISKRVSIAYEIADQLIEQGRV
jgi:hypothetical protein